MLVGAQGEEDKQDVMIQHGKECVEGVEGGGIISSQEDRRRLGKEVTFDDAGRWSVKVQDGGRRRGRKDAMQTHLCEPR